MSFLNGFKETDALFDFYDDAFSNAEGTSSMSDTLG